MRRILGLFSACAVVLALSGHAFGKDPDGRYANSLLKRWFDGLTDKKGQSCCSDADGTALTDADWRGTQDGNYEVFIEGQWMKVPPEAVITKPNLYGKTMVWPLRGAVGLTIRCFMPGPMT